LIELFRWLNTFRDDRRRENLSQSALLKKELALIGLAMVVISVLLGFLFFLAWIAGR
jgi:hypothetical protein